MSQPAFAFPKPLSLMVARLPALPPSLAFTAVLNLALGRIIRQEALQPLHGKRIAIRVLDVGLRLYFTVSDKGFAPSRTGAEPDLAISATARDFYLLAKRKEDPDTLFFSRRLIIEGDTELGLVAKNTLDSIELPSLTAAMLAPSTVLAQIKARFTSSHSRGWNE